MISGYRVAGKGARIIFIACALLSATAVLAWTGAPSGTPPACPAGYAGCDAPLNVGSTGQFKLGNLGITGYLNFSSTLGTGGYGIRDNSGTIEYKNSGGSWAAVGSGGSSGTPVSFLVMKSANQTVSNSTWTKVTWDTETFDTNNNFASDRFTPTVAGKYQINANLGCNTTTSICQLSVIKNGNTTMATSWGGAAGGSFAAANVSAVVDMNGSSDYIEISGLVGSGSSFFSGSSFSGALLSSQSGGSSQWTTSGTSIYYNIGNVGINKSSPSQKLDVGGNVTATDYYDQTRAAWASTFGRLGGQFWTNATPTSGATGTTQCPSGSVVVGVWANVYNPEPGLNAYPVTQIEALCQWINQ